MKNTYTILTIAIAIFLGQPLTTCADTAETRLWEALRSENHFALIRHALAPGTGDPANFMRGVRKSQRNLSMEGRNQATYIGALFRANGISEAQVFSSEWFRCMDTAELLDLGQVKPLTALNSFFQEYHLQEQRTKSLKNWLARQRIDTPLILVTHQVNITALTGVFPASGEIVVMEKDAEGYLQLLGTIETR